MAAKENHGPFGKNFDLWCVRSADQFSSIVISGEAFPDGFKHGDLQVLLVRYLAT